MAGILQAFYGNEWNDEPNDSTDDGKKIRDSMIASAVSLSNLAN